MSVYLSPLFNGWQGFTTGGLPLNAGLIYTYIAGGTTPQATYTTVAGNVQNANPIVLGSDGRPPSEIWLSGGATYRFDLKDSLGNLIKTYDNIMGMNSVSASAYNITSYGNDLTTAIAAIGSTVGTLLVTIPITLSADATVPSTLTLQVQDGGTITTTGHTLTINGPFYGGFYKIFLGSGTVVFGQGGIASYPVEWWGAAVGAAAATNNAAFQACWTSVPEGSKVVYQSGTYACTTLSHPTKKLNHLGFGGVPGGTPTSGTIITGTGTPVLDWPLGSPGSRDSEMVDMELRGTTTGQTVLSIKNHGLNLRRVKAASGLIAIEVQKMYGSTWDEVYAFGSASEANSIGCKFNPTGTQQIDQNTIISLQLNANTTTGTGLKMINGGAGCSGNTFINPIATLCNTSYDIDGLQNTFISSWSEQVTTAHIIDAATAQTMWLNPINLSTGTITYGAASIVLPPTTVAFTPTLSFATPVTTAPSYTIQTGIYVKIGNRVFFELHILLSSKGDYTGAATITLPVTIKAATTNPSFVVGYANSFAAGVTTAMVAVGSANSTNLSLYKFAAGASTLLVDTDFQNTSEIFISGNYVF